MDPKYKRMVKALEAKQKRKRKKSASDPWFVYLLRCADGSLYTGITNDVNRRLRKHQEGVGARYTRTRRPVSLLYQEKLRDRAAALIRECEVKSFPKKKKEALVGA